MNGNWLRTRDSTNCPFWMVMSWWLNQQTWWLNQQKWWYNGNVMGAIWRNDLATLRVPGMMAHELPMKAESSSTGPTLQAGEFVQGPSIDPDSSWLGVQDGCLCAGRSKKVIASQRPDIPHLPSGKHTKSYWKWPFIVDLPSYKMVIFHSYVSLPEGKWDARSSHNPTGISLVQLPAGAHHMSVCRIWVGSRSVLLRSAG